MMLAGALATPLPATPQATSRPDRVIAETRPAAVGLLAGPRVEASAIDEPRGRRQRDRPRISGRRWLDAYRSLELDDGQRRVMRRVLGELSAARKAFENEHGAEVKSLRKQMRDVEDASPDPVVRARLRELQAKAPNVVRYQRRLWNQLTGDQRRALREDLRRRKPEQRRRPDRREDRTPRTPS